MKKRKLRGYVLPTLYCLTTIAVFALVLFLGRNVNLVDKDYNYSSDILDDDNVTSVVVEDKVVSNTIASPIDVGTAQIATHFYSKDDEALRQQESLIYYENTYLPNTGLMYASDNEFEVKAVFDGKVIDILDDEFFGKCLVIEHSSNLRTYYYGLNDIDVNKGDAVSNGQYLGVSNNNEIMNSKKTFLLEVYYNNELLNPEEFIGTKITDYK